MGSRHLSKVTLRRLIDMVEGAPAIDQRTEAWITATLVAPTGSLASVKPVTGDIFVSTHREQGIDVMWEKWPEWRMRWAAGSLDAAFGVVDRNLPGVGYHLARGRLSADAPPYGCQLIFGAHEVLGTAEHEDGPSAVILALLKALLAQHSRSNRRATVMGTA